jgi:cytochrome P450
MNSDVLYDHLAPEMGADPYPAYQRLREEAPVYHNEQHDMWALSRYADVQAAFRDWNTFTSAKGVDPANWALETGFGTLLAMDPPRHDVLRTLVRRRFATKAVRDLRTQTEQVICPLVADATKADRADLAELAKSVAVRAMSDFMGVSPVTGEQLQAALVLSLDGLGEGSEDALSPAVFKGAEMFSSVMDEALDQRHRQEHDDLTATIAGGETAGLLDRAEAIGLCAVAFFGALDTTAAAIEITAYLLAVHPELRRSVVGGDVSVAQAIEECIRYHAPIQWVMRTTTHDVQIHDRTIPEGARVLLLQGSANRDPRQFERADVLDFDRPRAQHMGFGDGVHFCIGAPLARLWAATTVTELLRHAPEYALDGPARRSASSMGYGLDTLPVRLRP